MSVKSEVSNNYLNTQKQLHGNKPMPVKHNILITGDGQRNSIGEAIVRKLRNKHIVVSFHGDVCATMDCTVNVSSDCTALIMCHGKMWLDWLEDAPLSKIEDVVNVNLTGSIKLTQAFVKATIDNPFRKTIISVGSMAYKAILNGSAAYCASKAGLAHFMKCCAWELASKGYDVYSIHPSNTEGTPMSFETVEGLKRYRHMTSDQAESYWRDSCLRNEQLSTDDIAGLVSYLLEAAPTYLSGTNLEMAGGQR